MILDKKLKLVDNQSIGTKSFGGLWISADKLNISSLRTLGKGEQAYCCVTIRSAFNNASSNVAFYLLSESNASSKEAVDVLGAVPGTVAAATYITIYTQPLAGCSGYISALSSDGNFVAGKRFIFPINPFTANVKSIGGLNENAGNLYFAMMEIDSNGLPAASVTSGSIDVEIVTLAEPGAGSGFCDLMYYPTSIKVQ